MAKGLALGLLIAACLGACGASTTGVDSGQPDTGGSAVRRVTVGVFMSDGSGGYTDSGRSIVYDVGTPCFTWSRQSPGHAAMGDLPENLEPHLHYNAADDTSYVDGVFTWTEYGPEHAQADIEATCATGVDGVTKQVNATDYFDDHGGIYLRIVAVE